MSADTGVSTETAALMSLFAASLWGTWSVSLKYLYGYPIAGFVVTLYASSFVFVWAVSLMIERRSLFSFLGQTLRGDPSRVLGIVAGGAVFAIGMSFTLTVLNTIGLSVAQPIQSSLSIILGQIGTVVVGGVPDTVSLGRIMVAVGILICAVICTMVAAWFRAQPRDVDVEPLYGVSHSMADIRRSLPIIVLASLMGAAYPWTLSFGLKSPTQPSGLDVLPYMTLLVSGAFLGALAVSGVSLYRHNQWKLVICAPFSVRRWGMASGMFHFGGNIIHSVGTASLSASVSFPLGLSAAFWTQFWGLLHGEFKGAPVKAHLALGFAILLYVAGVAVIVSTL